ncbi:hypothetical protein [Nocardia salmonicida]|uniref:hypothetical protein n=1 Tax=Nocardia salmonicida TaxID=53431 RepID=UPI0007A43E54|nr:hypothetical protein [Nocardia salmonicida]
MAAPRSLRYNRYYPWPGTGHREDLLRITGVCDHCESEMYQRELDEQFAALPVAERIASRWSTARKRLARVAENANFETFGPPF